MKLKQGILLYFILFVILSTLTLIRPINHDEAYYTYASIALSEGKIPFADYLYHQMPLMILVYFPVSFYGIESLFLGRILSIVLLLASYLLIEKFFIRPRYGDKYRVIFSLLFFVNSLLINWTILIKQYSLSILLIVICAAGLRHYIDKRYSGKLAVFICFLSLSLLTLTRIMFLSMLAVFFIFFIVTLFRHTASKVPHLFAALAGLIIPFAVFLFAFENNLKDVYDNVITANFLIRSANEEKTLQKFIELSSFFILPQNLILFLVIFTSGKLDIFQKILILNIAIFYFLHLRTQMFVEYLVPMIPMILIIAFERWGQFVNNDKFLKSFGHHRKIKLVIVAYCFMVPFGITHFKHLIEGKGLMINPVQLCDFVSKIDKLDAKNILSSWEGYSIYSRKEPLLPGNYQGLFLNDMYDSLSLKLRKNLKRDIDYRNLILAGIPDILVYENKNPMHFTKVVEAIEVNYEPNFTEYSITVYTRKH